MNDSINVKIPLNLLFQAISLLERIDVAACGRSVQMDYNNVLFALNKKKEAIELREAYSGIITAGDDASRQSARMQYLEQKRRLRERS